MRTKTQIKSFSFAKMISFQWCHKQICYYKSRYNTYTVLHTESSRGIPHIISYIYVESHLSICAYQYVVAPTSKNKQKQNNLKQNSNSRYSRTKTIHLRHQTTSFRQVFDAVYSEKER